MIPQVDVTASHRPRRFAGAARTPVAASLPLQPHAPQFSGGLGSVAMRAGNQALQGATEKLIPIFQKITEVFVWAFLAQDAIAMWLPRVGTSLTTGRIKYETAGDKDVQNLPFKEQAKIWLRKNIKGLNWVNFNEETKREFATGPGVLTIPAIIFAVSRRMFGKSATELSYHSLKEMTHGFQEHLGKSGLAHEVGEIGADKYQAEVRKYIAGMFQDPDYARHLLPDHLRTDAVQNYRQYIDDWAGRYVDAVFNASGSREKNKLLGQLAEQFEEVLTGFNRNYRLKPYQYTRNNFTEAVERPLHRSGYIHVAFDDASKAAHEPIGHVLKNIRRWSDLAESVWAERGVGQKLAEVAENVFKKIAAKKFLIAVGTTALAGAYLIKLAFWAQNHDSYNATRLLKDTGAAPGAHGAGASAARQQQPPQSASNYGALPLVQAPLSRPQGFQTFQGYGARKGGQA